MYHLKGRSRVPEMDFLVGRFGHVRFRDRRNAARETAKKACLSKLWVCRLERIVKRISTMHF